MLSSLLEWINCRWHNIAGKEETDTEAGREAWCESQADSSFYNSTLTSSSPIKSFILPKFCSCLTTSVSRPIILSARCWILKIREFSSITEYSMDESSITVLAPMLVNGPMDEFLTWQFSAMETGPRMRLFSITAPSLISTFPLIQLCESTSPLMFRFKKPFGTAQ